MKSLVTTALTDLDYELANTRRMLERVPADQLDFKPHEKSFALGKLAKHLTDLAHLACAILTTKDFSFDAAPSQPSPDPSSAKEFVELWDERVGTFKSLLEKASDEDLMTVWTATSHGHTVIQKPRIEALRTVFINHTAHHRGQLSVYYRLTGVTVPGMYGPSGDELR